MAVPAGGSSPKSNESSEALATLSALLASHREHLLGLYTSLGYAKPQSHVSSKITELHSSLIATVKQQAKEAEDEVEGLKREAEGIERRIRSARISLGNPTPAGGLEEGLGEVEGENLIKRLDRLRKLESSLAEAIEVREAQVNGLEQRLEEYAPVLGEEVVRGAIEGEADKSQAKMQECGRDLSLARIQRLERECAAFDDEVHRRNLQLFEHLQDIYNIWGDLGISPALGPQQSLRSLSTTPDHADFDQLVLGHLGIKPATETEPEGTCEPDLLLPTDQYLERARARREWLAQEKASREAEIQKLYDEIAPLWTGLGVPFEEQEEFIEAWMGLSDACIDGYRAELERMKAERAKHMAVFIGTEREAIQALWNQMYVGEDERAGVGMMWSEAYSEELLLAHQAERQRLEEELVHRAPVLRLLDRYFGLIQEAHELEMSEKDPDRFSKGKRGDPGKLLREEKIRKRVQKEKPKLETDLQKMIPNWEAEHNQAFLVNGSRFLDDLVAKLESEAAAKEIKRTKTGTVSAPTVKRQQTGVGAGKPGSPPKRPRTATASRIQPQVTGTRGNAIPFGSHAQNGVPASGGASKASGGGGCSGRPTAAQKTGSLSSSALRGSAPALVPQATGSSSAYYNPVTPTPYYGGPPAMLAHATTVQRLGKGRPAAVEAAPGRGVPPGWPPSSSSHAPDGRERLFSPEPGADQSASAGGPTFAPGAAAPPPPGRTMSFRPRQSITAASTTTSSTASSSSSSSFQVRSVSVASSASASASCAGRESGMSAWSARTGTSAGTSMGGSFISK